MVNSRQQYLKDRLQRFDSGFGYFFYQLLGWGGVLLLLFLFWLIFGRTVGGEAVELPIFYSEG